MKQDKVSTDNKVVDKNKKAKKSGKPNFFVRIWKKLREVFSELKKVTWPTFGKVVKQTGVVIVVVLIFLIVISLMDVGLTALLNLVRQ